MFTSYEFILFVSVCFVVYYLIPKRTQPYMLLLVSYLIYFSLDVRYPVYLLVTTVTVYLSGCYIRKKKIGADEYLNLHKSELSREERKQYKAKAKQKMKAVLICCMVFNLGILAVTKYTNFFIQNVNRILHTFGNDTYQ